jgi:hypothetical protein
MKDEITTEFEQKEKRLIDLCTEIAAILRQSDRSRSASEAAELETAAHDLRLAVTIEDKREIVATIKSRFHKEGIFDWGPPGMKWEDWRAKADELHDLVWIYQEAKYSGQWRN